MNEVERQVTEDSKKEIRCCCGCHITTATQIFCWFYLIGSFLYILAFFPFGSLITAGFVLSYALGIYGIRKNKTGSIYLIILAVSIDILMAFYGFIYVIYLFLNDDKVQGDDDYNKYIQIIIYIVICISAAVRLTLDIWFFITASRCKLYLDKKELENIRQQNRYY